MGIRYAAHKRGGGESTKLLGMLNLPWQVFEKKIAKIEEALQDETKETLEHNNQSYVDWCALSDKEKNNNKVKITVTYDMGWQKISYGGRYESSGGHAFIIGGGPFQ